MYIIVRVSTQPILLHRYKEKYVFSYDELLKILNVFFTEYGIGRKFTDGDLSKIDDEIFRFGTYYNIININFIGNKDKFTYHSSYQIDEIFRIAKPFTRDTALDELLKEEWINYGKERTKNKNNR